jgi:hypothetical protein
MRAHINNSASPIALALTAALSSLALAPNCSAQIEPAGGRHLVLFVYNRCDHAIKAGEIELREVPGGGGVDEAIAAISTEAIPRGEYTWTYFPDPLQQGRRYRVIFRAECASDGSKIVYRESRAFEFRFAENWRSLNIDGDDLRDRGNLVRVEFGKGLNTPDVVFAKPGDLIEIDYLFQGTQATVEPKGGSRSQIVDASPIGPRPIVVNGKSVGIASFFEAKSRGDDWVAIQVAGVSRNFHIFVRSK